MKPFRNISLKRKQTLILMLTSGTALLLACMGFFTYEVLAFRHSMVSNLSTLAEIVANNSTAGLDFNDPKAVEETLSALQAEPSIIGAAVYARDGRVFAVYDRAGNGSEFVPPRARAGGWEFKSSRLLMSRPIHYKGETIGSVYMESDLNALSSRLRQYVLIGLGVLGASCLAAFVLSSRLQRLISGPILHLVQTARSIAHEKNYALRATKTGDDELGVLVESFNEMLSQIQHRDAELERSRDALEHRVRERTAELAGANTALQKENHERESAEKELRWKTAFLEAQVTSSLDGILVVNNQGQKILQNERFNELWKLPPEISRDPDETRTLRHVTDQLRDPEQFLDKVRHLYSHPDEISNDEIVLQNGTILDRHTYPVVDKEGTRYGRLWTFRDATERKRAEESLRLLSSAIEQSADNVVLTDKDGTIEYVNPAFLRLTGYSREEMVGQSTRLLKSGRHTNEFYHELWACILSGKPFRAEFTNRKKNGDIFFEEKIVTPVFDSAGKIAHFVASGRDVTERKKTEAEMESLNRQLLEVSRSAGMAEVATGVLHNVGNVLNSVNVTATLVEEQLSNSRLSDLARLVALLKAQNGSLGRFLTEDPRGKKVPEFLSQLAEKLGEEQAAALQEMGSLRNNIEHIKEIVAMQQNYARVSGITETLQIKDLVEDTLRMNAGALVRHEVNIHRDYQEVPPITTDKHKVLQILVNLVRNAKYACEESGCPDKQITVRISHSEDSLRVSVADNGVGILSENLTRVFNHGFTTRKDGHGFGLHSGALAAKDLGGSLTVQSDGFGKGAIFTLELPCPRTTD